MEGEHEIDGLRFWDGDPTVRLLDADDANQAMLLERCEPGSDLREVPEPRQDQVIAMLLRRLWRRPPKEHPFQSLSDMIRSWGEESMADRASWPDTGLVEAGLQLLDELSTNSKDEDQVLLVTDLHAGNVLRAQRKPWLAPIRNHSWEIGHMTQRSISSTASLDCLWTRWAPSGSSQVSST